MPYVDVKPLGIITINCPKDGLELTFKNYHKYAYCNECGEWYPRPPKIIKESTTSDNMTTSQISEASLAKINQSLSNNKTE